MSFPPLSVRKQVSLPLQASKWLTIPVLVDVEEMQSLLFALGEFWIFLVSGLTPKGDGSLTQKEFLDCYHHYVEALKKGQMPDDPRIRSYFSSVWTVSTDPLYALELENDQQLIKVHKPVLQLQPHRFDYSSLDGKFRSGVFGVDCVWWGIQFSYPQLYQDEQLIVKQVKETSEFPNTALFKALQRWIRQFTVATPFLVEGRKVNVPIRLGKNCFEWINQHPQLGLKGLKVII